MRQRFLTGSLFVIAVLLTVFLGHRWWTRLNQPTVLCPGCNVIIVDIDTFRADAFDCKGKPGDSGHPPNLCKFVKDAFKFENNFSQSHWTLPSMVSTHTGLYPPEHGVERMYEDVLHTSKQTAVELLQNNWYATFRLWYDGRHLISKYSNTDRGYGQFINSERFPVWNIELRKMKLLDSPFYALFYFGGLHSPYTLDKDNKFIFAYNRNPFFPITKEEFSEEIDKFVENNYNQIFLNGVKGVPKKHIADFLYSIQWNKDMIKKYLINDWSTTYYTKIISPIYQQAIVKDVKVAEKIHDVYNANVKEVDNDFSLFLNELKQLGLEENTVIVFMSDHGEGFNEHGYIDHKFSPGAQYNEFLHTPLYIYIPGIKGTVINEASQNIDIFPTIFEIVGIDSSTFDKWSHGKSLIPLMGNIRWWNFFQNRFAISFSRSLASIQNNRWKMILDVSGEDRIKIYDLRNDPGEKNNVASSSLPISYYLTRQLEQTFGFKFEGLGFDWEERFAK